MPSSLTFTTKLISTDYTRLADEVSKRIAPDIPLSPYVVTLDRSDINFYEGAVQEFVSALQNVGNEYRQHLSDGEFTHPVVQMLERYVPPDLLPVLRFQPPQLDFTRLDFHQRGIIEYNSSPGGMVLSSVVDEVFMEQGHAESLQLGSVGPSVENADELILERVLLPLVPEKRQPTIAILERLGEYRTNIHGELSYLVAKANNKGMNILFPSSIDDFKFNRGKLVHKATGTPIDIVHIAASEGTNFGRWQALVGSAIFSAYLENAVAVWPRPSNALLTSKMLLAYLSEKFSEPGQEDSLLAQALAFARPLDDNTADDAKRRIAAGETIVLKPSNGSGGRDVFILDSTNRRSGNIINRHAREGGFIYMKFIPAAPVSSELVHTTDAVIFLDPNGNVDVDKLLYTTRVFAGKKFNTAGIDSGIAPVMKG